MNTFPEPGSLPAQPALPNALEMFDGSPVSSREHWFGERVPELVALFQHYMYGPVPPPAPSPSARVEDAGSALGGLARLKLVTLSSAWLPRLDVLLLLPRQRPAPVFAALNLCGNHTLLDDPRIPLPASRLADYCPHAARGSASNAGRGAHASEWDVKALVVHGYALAAVCAADADCDQADLDHGIRRAWARALGGEAEYDARHRGSIAAWAWALRRVVDYLQEDPEVDAQRIAVLGHSRCGKAALLAAAFDPRIALAIAHQAGTGGSAPSRSASGESIAALNGAFPHWFNARFKQFNDCPERLPFDQHALVALCAPRPVLCSNALEDAWANPSGQLQVLEAASRVYRWLGVEGLMPGARAELGLVPTRLGFFMRPGGHSIRVEDWRAFLAFADLHLRAGR